MKRDVPSEKSVLIKATNNTVSQHLMDTIMEQEALNQLLQNLGTQGVVPGTAEIPSNLLNQSDSPRSASPKRMHLAFT